MGMFYFFKKQHYKIGEIIKFGRYYFENEKDVQPIEWIVLENNKDKLLMISKYCLDVIHYFDQTGSVDYAYAIAWENSHLRKWLNDGFYDQAFTEKEKQRIVKR